MLFIASLLCGTRYYAIQAFKKRIKADKIAMTVEIIKESRRPNTKLMFMFQHIVELLSHYKIPA
jgi:hypothetical protein